MMMALVVYAFGILFTELISSDVAVPMSVRDDWSTIGKSMFRLMQILTYDTDNFLATDESYAIHVDDRGEELDVAGEPSGTSVRGKTSWVDMIGLVCEHKPRMLIFFIVFVVITSLGLMNLIIGIMVESTYSIVQVEKTRLRTEAINKAKAALVAAKSVFSSLGGGAAEGGGGAGDSTDKAGEEDNAVVGSGATSPNKPQLSRLCRDLICMSSLPVVSFCKSLCESV